jgi:hypothetical protein
MREGLTLAFTIFPLIHPFGLLAARIGGEQITTEEMKNFSSAWLLIIGLFLY